LDRKNTEIEELKANYRAKAKTDSHDITEIVLKVALNTINLDVKQLHDHPGANLRNKIITYI
jgi:hypothetical protein